MQNSTQSSFAPAPSSAPVWRRLAALVYDVFILLAVSFLYGASATLVGTLLGWHQADYQPMFHHWSFSLGWVAILVAFYVWFWHKSGQTIGMRTWRLKLVEGRELADGRGSQSTASWHTCLLRALVTPPLVLLGGVGYWYGLIDRQGLCLQDKLSRTSVILVAKEQ